MIGRRHELRHWAIRFDDGGVYIFIDRGDAFLEMGGSARLGNPEMYAAWRKLVRASLDKLVEESICKQLGGHQTVINGQCVECLTVVDWDDVKVSATSD